MTLTEELSAQRSMTNSLLKQVRGLQQALELIALGEVLDCQHFAESALVELGIWRQKEI